MMSYTYFGESLQECVDCLNKWLQAYTTEISSENIYVESISIGYYGVYCLKIYYKIKERILK